MAYRGRTRTDKNQSEIVRAMRQIGAKVISLSNVGDGCPDLLVGFRGRNILMEIKNGDAPPSERKLRDSQHKFIVSWTGQVCVIYSVDQAIEFLERL